MLVETIGYGVVLPMAVAAFIALPAAIRNCSAAVGRALGAAAAAAGFLAAASALDLVPLRPEPDHAWHWLPALCVIAATIGAIGGSWPIRAALCAGLAIAAAMLLVPAWESLDGQRAALRGLAGVGVLSLALIGAIIETAGGRGNAAMLVLIAAAGAVLLFHGGTAVFAQLAASLSAALVGVTFMANRPGIVAGLMPVVAVLLVGLLLTGCLQSPSEIPSASYVLIAAAPMPLVWPRNGIRMRLAAAAMLAAAVGMALIASQME